MGSGEGYFTKGNIDVGVCIGSYILVRTLRVGGVRIILVRVQPPRSHPEEGPAGYQSRWNHGSESTTAPLPSERCIELGVASRAQWHQVRGGVRARTMRDKVRLLQASALPIRTRPPTQGTATPGLGERRLPRRRTPRMLEAVATLTPLTRHSMPPFVALACWR